MRTTYRLICLFLAGIASSSAAAELVPFTTLASEAPLSAVYEVTLRQDGQEISAQTFDMAFYEDIIREQETETNKRNLYLNLYSGRSVHWTSFAHHGPVEVEVRVVDTVRQAAAGQTAVLLPSRRRVAVEQPEPTLYRFTIREPGQYSLEIGEQGYRQGLLVFADPLETDTPDPSGANWKTLSSATAADLEGLPPEVDSLYFQNGAHDIGVFNAPAQIRNIYFERGAWVYGAVRFTTAANSNVKAWGRGVLDGIKLAYKESHLFEAVGGASDIDLDGWVVANYTRFAVRLLGSDNHIQWAKLVSGWNHNSDGIAAYERSRVNNCFIWANDDNLKLYRNGMTVEDCVCWQLDNGAVFQLSWGSYTQDNISVKNVDIIRAEFSGAGKNHGILNARGSAGAVGGHSNFLFENITVETPTRSILKLAPEASQYTFDTFRFVNWQVRYDETHGQSNLIAGVGSSDAVKDFHFQDFVVNGVPVDQSNYLDHGRFELLNAETPTFSTTAGSSYQSWTRAHFSFLQLEDPSVSGPAADPEQDGLSNFQEYLLGTRPLQPDAPANRHIPQLAFDRPSSDALELRFDQPAQAQDLRWTLQASSDLRDWRPEQANHATIQPAEPGRETVSIRQQTIQEEDAFYRVKLEAADTYQAKNVLLIMADDFNFWTESDGYYSPVHTPNIDRLARQGVFFSSAHSPSPVCHPSRNALWSGVSPMASGIDSNGLPFIREVPGFEAVVTLNQFFKDHGYHVYGGGKLWHPGWMDPSNAHTDPENWSELNTGRTGANGGQSNRFESEIRSLVSWSANDAPMTEDNTHDFRLAKDVARFLENRAANGPAAQPFFVACGFFRPHLPWHSPKQFWDLFEQENIPLPPGADPEADLPGAIDYFKDIHDRGLWEQGIHAYLAACALADHNVGVLLDALEASPYADNTIVLFMGDHGWQLGEKGRWGKFSTWEAANKTTFIVYDPSALGNGQICPQPVTLQDVYPTLVELTGLPVKRDLDGRSLVPLLVDPQREDWDHPVVMQYLGTRYIQSREWRFIERGESSELYHLATDPYERVNLYGKAENSERAAAFRQQIADAVARSQAIHAGELDNPFVDTLTPAWRQAFRLPASNR